MMFTQNIVIEAASIENAEEILELQKMAYQSEAELINDYTIPPLQQTVEEIVSEFHHQVILKVESENKIVGSVRFYVDKGTCYIGKLIVHPDYQNNGIGTKLLNEAEKRFPDVDRFELFTGQKSQKNLNIYAKNGYKIFMEKKYQKN